MTVVSRCASCAAAYELGTTVCIAIIRHFAARAFLHTSNLIAKIHELTIFFNDLIFNEITLIACYVNYTLHLFCIHYLTVVKIKCI